jgi:hypothetical protein
MGEMEHKTILVDQMVYHLVVVVVVDIEPEVEHRKSRQWSKWASKKSRTCPTHLDKHIHHKSHCAIPNGAVVTVNSSTTGPPTGTYGYLYYIWH